MYVYDIHLCKYVCMYACVYGYVCVCMYVNHLGPGRAVVGGRRAENGGLR